MARPDARPRPTRLLWPRPARRRSHRPGLSPSDPCADSPSSSPAPRKRHVLDSDAGTSEDDRPVKRASKPAADLRGFFGSSSAARPVAPAAKKRKTAAPASDGLSQLVLDISDRPTTTTCAECDMSFSRLAPEDVALHRTFHVNVVGGIEWSNKLSKGVTVLEDGVGAKQTHRIVAVEATATGALGRKVHSMSGRSTDRADRRDPLDRRSRALGLVAGARAAR